MKLKQLQLQNFKSYGNNINTLDFNTLEGELILLMGKNGSGKCVDKSTEIEIEIDEKVFGKYKPFFGEKCINILKTNIGDLDKLRKIVEKEGNFFKDLNIKVKTRHGFNRINNVAITKHNSKYFTLKTSNNHNLLCSEEHRLLCDDKWTNVKNLKIGDVILTDKGLSNITFLELSSKQTDLYDISVDNVEEYYSNGIVSHNSSLPECIDYTIYNKVKGKKKSAVKSSELVNRYNSALYTRLLFEANNTELEIVRKGSKLEFYENGVICDRAGKANIQAKIEEYVDFDLDTWKSFISMSINDFKNFMTLTPEEKRMLLDRLFNLEMINDVSKILKEKKKIIKNNKSVFEAEILSYNNSLSEFKKSIEKLKESSTRNLDTEKEELKASILNKKDEFLNLKTKLDNSTIQEKELKENLKTTQDRFTKIKYEIANYDEKLKLYDNGQCPTCGSNLSNETHLTIKTELIEGRDKLILLRDEIKEDGIVLNKKVKEIENVTKEVNDVFFELKMYLKNLKDKLATLESDNNNDDNEIINQLNESINTIETNQSESTENLSNIKEEELILDNLLKLFSDGGIKKSIISKIVKPINHFITENLKELNFNFTIELDEEFSASIKFLGQTVDVETLSTGETKVVNIAILLAYLKLIRMKKHINIMFLDEVFSSIDIESIYVLLKLMRKFAKDYNINIFLVHHAQLEKSYFDRIIKVEKSVTSNIIEEK